MPKFRKKVEKQAEKNREKQNLLRLGAVGVTEGWMEGPSSADILTISKEKRATYETCCQFKRRDKNERFQKKFFFRFPFFLAPTFVGVETFQGKKVQGGTNSQNFPQHLYAF